MADFKELDLEKEIGSYGLKSKVFLGFTPRAFWLHPFIEGRRTNMDFHLNRNFYLKLELHCPEDFKEWKDAGKEYHSFFDGLNSGLTPTYYYFMETSSEMREFIKDCPFVKNCEVSKIDSVLKELEMRAFWYRVVRKKDV